MESAKERLGFYLKSKNITITALAKRIESHQQTLSKIINGKQSLTRRMAARILSACPDLSEEWLWHGTGSMLRDSSTVINVSDNARAAAHDYHEHHAPSPSAELDLIRARLDLIDRILIDQSHLLDSHTHILDNQTHLLDSLTSRLDSLTIQDS